MTDAEKSEISFVVCTIYGILLHFTLFCCKICIFLVFYAVLSQNRFLWFTRYCVEKNLAKNSSRGEKMTNMRYEGVPKAGCDFLSSLAKFFMARTFVWRRIEPQIAETCVENDK